MSPTPDERRERRERWERWWKAHSRAGWEIVGFAHGDSSITPVEEPHSDIVVCAGCRFEIRDPNSECTPVYRPVENALRLSARLREALRSHSGDDRFVRNALERLDSADDPDDEAKAILTDWAKAAMKSIVDAAEAS